MFDEAQQRDALVCQRSKSLPAQQKSVEEGNPLGEGHRHVCREEAFTIEERASARGGGEMMVSLLR